MSLSTLFFISAVVFLTIDFVLLPSLRWLLRRDRSPRAIVINGVLAATASARATALVSTLTCGVLLLLFLFADAYCEWSPESAYSTMLALEGMRSRLMGFGAGWSAAMAVLIVLGMIIYGYRKGARQMTGALERACQAQFELLQKRQERGELEPMEPNEDMQAITAKISMLQEKLATVESHASLPAAERGQMMLDYQANIQHLQAAYDTIDVARRVNVAVSSADAELPKPKNTWERFQTLLISQGLLRCCGLGKRRHRASGSRVPVGLA